MKVDSLPSPAAHDMLVLLNFQVSGKEQPGGQLQCHIHIPSGTTKTVYSTDLSPTPKMAFPFAVLKMNKQIAGMKR